MFANLPTMKSVSVHEADALISDEDAQRMIREETAETAVTETATEGTETEAEAVTLEPVTETVETATEVDAPVSEPTPTATIKPVSAPAQKKIHKNRNTRKPPATPRRGIVNVDTLDHYFKDGETVTLEELKQRRVPGVDARTTEYKLLGRGRLSKALTVVADEFSLKAVKMLLLTGGKAIHHSAN